MTYLTGFAWMALASATGIARVSAEYAEQTGKALLAAGAILAFRCAENRSEKV